MKPSLYLETTIPSYLVARPSRDVVVAGHQAVTHLWWAGRKQDFRVFVSQVVLDEAGLGDETLARKRIDLVRRFPMLDVSTEVISLAGELVHALPLPAKAARDAAHLAVAAINGMDFLLTWNCAHIANAVFFPRIEKLLHSRGFKCPVICTPDEMLGDSSHD